MHPNDAPATAAGRALPSCGFCPGLGGPCGALPGAFTAVASPAAAAAGTVPPAAACAAALAAAARAAAAAPLRWGMPGDDLGLGDLTGAVLAGGSPGVGPVGEVEGRAALDRVAGGVGRAAEGAVRGATAVEVVPGAGGAEAAAAAAVALVVRAGGAEGDA